MKLNKADLKNIKEKALNTINTTTKSRYETHDSYLAKCWIDALKHTLNSKGYELFIADGRGIEELEIE